MALKKKNGDYKNGADNKDGCSASGIRGAMKKGRGNGDNKKRSSVWNSFKKIGGDLLFHKQVQYHRRCEA